MYKSNIKIGSLIRYSNIDGEEVYGIVLEYYDYYENYREAAVKVHWFDDPEITFESISRLVSNKRENQYMEIISER
jgi:hypothetical protein